MNRSESRYFATAARMDEAFLTLLAKKDFEYITVKEICEVAEVNRSTLYLHYETMSDFHYICYRCDSAVCKNATKRNNERCLITSSFFIFRNRFVVLSILSAKSICKMSLSKTQIFLFFESGNYVQATRFFTEFQVKCRNFRKIAFDHCKTCSERFVI